MKVKRSIYTICLICILLLSSVLLFACGKKESNKGAYNAYHSLMTTMVEEAELFADDQIDGNQTDFYLNDFFEKNPSNEDLYIYNHYTSLLSVGLDFIQKYYPVLESLKLKTDYSDLKEEATTLKKSFNKVKTAHTNLKTEAVEVNYIVYNGYFSKYRYNARNLINKTYSCALSLAKFLDKEVKFAKTVATDKMTTEALNFYYDYNILKVVNDFRIFFMASCKGEAVEHQIYNNTVQHLAKWTAISAKTCKSLTAEQAKELKIILSKVNAEKSMTKTALSKFSVYKLVEEHLSSLTVYAKSNQNAPVYYERIEGYFDNDTSTLKNLYNYLTANVVA